MSADWPALPGPTLATWAIAACATAGVILRPARIPEAAWALSGALMLLVLGLLPWQEAVQALGRGADVICFLLGMMVLAELARSEGLFDTLAAWAIGHARGSGARLFALVYGVGVLVTVFLSNDATAVVLTPAVHVAARRAGARPLPYLFACALVANAASFVLPISNPANLVVFDGGMPALMDWVRIFALPSLAAIGVTWAVLRRVFAAELREPLHLQAEPHPLSASGRRAAWGTAAVALVLVGVSAAGVPLGVPTMLATAAAVAWVHGAKRESPWPLMRHVSWSVLALVAGLFVLVAGLEHTGVIDWLAKVLHAAAVTAPRSTAWAAGGLVGVGCNLMNNLPAGLVAGLAAQSGALPESVRAAIALGIDLGPNLSVTGSLATILWLIALRREGEHVGALSFLRIGALAMPAALLVALALLA